MAAAAIAVVSLPAAAVAFGPPPGAELSVEKLQRIDDFLNGEIAAGKIPGAIVLIQRRGQPVYFKSFGKRDVDTGVPMTTDTIFPIHSVTKTITSVAAMMLVDRGKIALGRSRQQIHSVLRRHEGRRRAEGRERASRCSIWCRCDRPVTIEDLLLHTSGIPYGFYGDGLVKKSYADVYLGDLNNAEFVERLATLPLASQPGTLWDYGHSTDVRGCVIEVISGKSLFQFVKERLLDPLGMSETAFFVADTAKRTRDRRADAG